GLIVGPGRGRGHVHERRLACHRDGFLGGELKLQVDGGRRVECHVRRLLDGAEPREVPGHLVLARRKTDEAEAPVIAGRGGAGARVCRGGGGCCARSSRGSPPRRSDRSPSLRYFPSSAPPPAPPRIGPRPPPRRTESPSRNVS